MNGKSIQNSSVQLHIDQQVVDNTFASVQMFLNSIFGTVALRREWAWFRVKTKNDATIVHAVVVL